MLRQPPQLGDALIDVRYVLVDYHVDCGAVFRWARPKIQQTSDLALIHVQVTAVEDEAQLLDLGVRIHAIVAFGARRLVHQPTPLVVANVLNGYTKLAGQGSNLSAFHCIPTGCLTLELLQGFKFYTLEAVGGCVDSCCNDACEAARPTSARYRRVLWTALVLNTLMFVVEIVASQQAQSASLLADAVDFLGDAGNYSVSLFALSMGALWRARAAMLKGITMGLFGLVVLARAGWGAFNDFVPHATTMGAIGLLALIVNVSVAVLLYKFREGDANMRSVWLCSRNDAIGNVAVIGAGVLVTLTNSAWPDLAVALVMGLLAILASKTIIAQARAEIAESHARPLQLERRGAESAQP